MANRIKSISKFSNSAWGKEVAIGADAENVDLYYPYNAATFTNDNNVTVESAIGAISTDITNLKLANHKDGIIRIWDDSTTETSDDLVDQCVVGNTDDTAEAWSKFNKFRRRVKNKFDTISAKFPTKMEKTINDNIAISIIPPSWGSGYVVNIKGEYIGNIFKNITVEDDSTTFTFSLNEANDEYRYAQYISHSSDPNLTNWNINYDLTLDQFVITVSNLNSAAGPTTIISVSENLIQQYPDERINNIRFLNDTISSQWNGGTIDRYSLYYNNLVTINLDLKSISNNWIWNSGSDKSGILQLPSFCWPKYETSLSSYIKYYDNTISKNKYYHNHVIIDTFGKIKISNDDPNLPTINTSDSSHFSHWIIYGTYQSNI